MSTKILEKSRLNYIKEKKNWIDKLYKKYITQQKTKQNFCWQEWSVRLKKKRKKTRNVYYYCTIEKSRNRETEAPWRKLVGFVCIIEDNGGLGGGVEETERQRIRGRRTSGCELVPRKRPGISSNAFYRRVDRRNPWGTSSRAAKKTRAMVDEESKEWERAKGSKEEDGEGFFFAARKACKLEWRNGKGKFSVAFLNSEARASWNIKLSRGELSI